MDILIAVLVSLVCLQSVCLYSLILVLRSISRTQERKDNVHRAQVSELLDRLAWQDNKPYGLPPRPPEVETEPDPLEHDWREV